MPIKIQRNELPPDIRESVARGILSAIGDSDGIWQVDIMPEAKANAWDVEVQGPNEFHWARRFSGVLAPRSISRDWILFMAKRKSLSGPAQRAE